MRNDDHLIQRFNEGQEKALENIFMQFHARLCFTAVSIVNNENEAEDIVQDAFIKLWQLRSNFISLNAVKAFLYLAVKNSSRNVYKHQQVKARYVRSVDMAAYDNSFGNRIIEAEVLQFVYCGLQKLPDGCRKVINLSYLQGLSNQQVADALRVSINTVKTQKMRGLRLLRSSFENVQASLLY